MITTNQKKYQPLGEGSLYAAQPHGMGDLFAAQFVCVGFHSLPGEGAASWEATMKMIHETHEKKTKNLCNL
jgi:hypothetical protein